MRLPIQKQKAFGGVPFLAAAAIALLLFGPAISAQVAPSVSAAAIAVVQRAVTAHGARQITGEISDWIAEGKLTYFNAKGPKATFEMTLTRKGKTKVQRVVKQPAAEVRTGSDGTRAWHSLGGFFIAAAQGHALQFLESQTVRSVQILFNHRTEGLSLSDKGQSGKMRVIEAQDAGGRKTSYFIDDDTSTVTRLEFVTGEVKDPFSGRMAPMTDSYVFADYRMVQEVLTPFKIERYIGGIKAEEMQFNSVRYNASVRDDTFKP